MINVENFKDMSLVQKFNTIYAIFDDDIREFLVIDN